MGVRVRLSRNTSMYLPFWVAIPVWLSLLWPDVNAEFRSSSDSRSDGEPRPYTDERGGPAVYLSISRQAPLGLDTT